MTLQLTQDEPTKAGECANNDIHALLSVNMRCLQRQIRCNSSVTCLNCYDTFDEKGAYLYE